MINVSCEGNSERVVGSERVSMDERHGRRVGITTWDECLTVERSGKLPRSKADQLFTIFGCGV